jgi:hypothetical protein
MQQIADWLNSLGMSEYAQRFAENRIDFSVLPDLTDRDLKDLGIVLGDRRKILRAIAELGSAPVVAPAGPSATRAPIPTASPIPIAAFACGFSGLRGCLWRRGYRRWGRRTWRRS